MALLRESLNKSNQMTQNMMTILTSFENRLGKLEGTITPVYQETKSLQIRHESILEHILFRNEDITNHTQFFCDSIAH